MNDNDRPRSSIDLDRFALPHHRLRVHTLALQLIGLLRPLMPRIRKHDRSLHDQLRNAASSAHANIAESEHSDPGNRRARLDTAAGSASEARDHLWSAVAWGYVSEAEVAHALDHADHLVAGLFKLRHR